MRLILSASLIECLIECLCEMGWGCTLLGQAQVRTTRHF